MFKELGAFIDAVGEVSVGTLKKSAQVIKSSLSDKEDDEPLQGIVDPDIYKHNNYDDVEIYLSDKRPTEDEFVYLNQDEDSEED